MTDPIVMTDAELEAYSWRRDDMHFPRPVTPLFASVFTANAGTYGLNKLRVKYGLPATNLNRVRDGYVYGASLPFPGDVKESVARWQTHLPDLKENLRRRWDDEYLPELRRDVDRCLSWTGELGDAASVLAELDRRIEMNRRHWTIHFEIVIPYGDIENEFRRKYSELLKPEDPDEVFRLLHGHNSITFAANEALWKVVQTVKETPEAARVLRNAAPAYVLPTWKVDPACGPAVEALDRFLQEYGLRPSAAGFDWCDPLWVEDPTPVVTLMQGYLESDWDPQADRRRAQERAEQLLEGALARLEEPARTELQTLYEKARAVCHLKEDHNYWIDQVSALGTNRLFFMALGRRLVRDGVCDRPDDVFYFYLGELRDAIAQPADRRDLIAARRADHKRQAETRPPMTLGREPEKKFQSDFMGEDREDPGEGAVEFKGYGACKGTVTGTARVVFGPEQFGRVQKGDILVCPTTTPPWTALFRIAAGVVTDTGGILSHSAMVAREYGLPAVVGTKHATRLIQDGQRVTIDGATGVVKIHKP